MYTAMLSAENVLGGDHDVWSVNIEDDYHEEHRTPSRSGTGRAAPLILPGSGSGGGA
jgi:hypothetical protein